MKDEKPDPIANTAAFRAFSADDEAAGGSRRRPSTFVFVTTIVVLAALVLGVLAAVL